MATRSQQIALAFPRGSHQEVLIEGVTRFASENALPWSLTIAPESLLLSVLDLSGWPGDGVLAALNTKEEAEYAATLSMPVVNISSALAESPVPRTMVDNYAIGELAADHLFARGFREFGFFGLEEIQYSRTRWLGFSESLEKQGCSCSQLLATPTFRFDGATWMSQYEQLSKWLQSLQRPCGVFVVSDYRACQVLEACREQGISVPDQVAVVGVDDEQVICEHVSPTLTSVARNDALEGYKAAEMLDMLMKGEGLPSQEVIVPPSEVVTRDSTAAFAVSDERLHKALAHLHDHIHKPITIEELAAHADVSRRWLEYAFRDVFRETPYQYIRRQRLMKAKQLLADEPKASITSVAKRTGFASVKQMRIAFQQAYGMSPGEFRRSFES